MRYYIATTLSNAAQHNYVRDRLAERGFACTYDWTVHGSLQDEPGRWDEVAEKELDGVIEADVVIVLLPGGKGTHVELGAALALEVPVFLLAEAETPEREVIFHHHPGVTRYPSDALDLLIEDASREMRDARLHANHHDIGPI